MTIYNFLVFSTVLAASATWQIHEATGNESPVRQYIQQHTDFSLQGELGQLHSSKIIRSQVDPHRPAGNFVSMEAIIDDKGGASIQNEQPVITSDQVTNKDAAFEITGAGLAEFNGVYMPSDLQNTAGACTSLTWQKGSGDSIYLLYNMNGAWIMDLRGQTPSYNGADDGSCTPETAAWAAVAQTAGSAPTSLVRRTASTFQLSPPGPLQQGAAPVTVPTAAPPTPAQTFFVVSGSGLPGFNGVYYETSLVVADQRCQRTFAKDGPMNTEYTLSFASPLWFFASLIGGQTNRPYIGQDDGSCSPELVTWIASKATDAPVPTVVRTTTATPTTTTTTVVVAVTTTTKVTVAVTTIAAAPAAVPVTTTAALTTTNSNVGAKNNGRPASSPWFYLPVLLGLAFEGLQLSP